METTYSSLKVSGDGYRASVEKARASMVEFQQERSDAFELIQSTFLTFYWSFHYADDDPQR